MTQKDGSPEASEGPYWSEELLAVLVVGLGDETQARETLEGIIQQALSGRALQGISEEALASCYLSKLYERIAELRKAFKTLRTPVRPTLGAFRSRQKAVSSGAAGHSVR